MLANNSSDPELPPKRGFGLSLTRKWITIASGLLLALYVIANSMLFLIANHQDHSSIEQTRLLVTKALESELQKLSTTLVSHAAWADAYKNLHYKVNQDWAYARGNFGLHLYEDLGYEGVLVIGPSGETSYAMIHGKPSNTSLNEWLGESVRPFIEPVSISREGPPIRLEEALVWAEGHPALVVAMPLTPGADGTVETTTGPPSVVVFVNQFNVSELKAIGENFNVEDLHVDMRKAPSALLNLPTRLPEPIGLSWSPPEPGSQLLKIILPLLLLIGIVGVGLAWVVFNRAIKAASEIDKSQEKLVESQLRFRDVAEASSDWIWETDASLRIMYLSDRFFHSTGLMPDKWLGKKLTDLFSGLNKSSPCLISLTSEPIGGLDRCTYTAPGGNKRTCQVSWRRIREGSLVGGFRGTARDITEEVEAQSKIEYLSQHDALTGLPNRTRLQRFLTEKLTDASETPQRLAILCIDLDGFKPVNDSFGHEAGDLVLSEVADRLRACLREGDLVARMGGDEFILIVSDVKGRDEVAKLCARLIERIEQPYDSYPVQISASVGIATTPADAANPEDLLRFADAALYEAKRAGRRTWRFYSEVDKDNI